MVPKRSSKKKDDRKKYTLYKSKLPKIELHFFFSCLRESLLQPFFSTPRKNIREILS